MSNKTLMRLVKLNKLSNAGFTYFCAQNVHCGKHAIHHYMEKQILSLNAHNIENGQLNREGKELPNYQKLVLNPYQGVLKA